MNLCLGGYNKEHNCNIGDSEVWGKVSGSASLNRQNKNQTICVCVNAHPSVSAAEENFNQGDRMIPSVVTIQPLSSATSVS